MSGSEGPTEPGAPTAASEVARLVPCFEQIVAATVRLAAAELGDAPRVLVLGVGPGVLPGRLARARPGAAFSVVDESADELARLAAALAGQQVSCDTIQGPLTEPPPGPFDAAVSSLVLHRLGDDDKRLVFRRVNEALRPDGIFACAEQVAGPSLALDDLYHRSWVEQVRDAGVDDAQIDQALESMVYDHPATVPDQLVWMVDAGLRDVDCFFKDYRYAVLGGWAAPSTGP